MNIILMVVFFVIGIVAGINIALFAITAMRDRGNLIYRDPQDESKWVGDDAAFDSVKKWIDYTSRTHCKPYVER